MRRWHSLPNFILFIRGIFRDGSYLKYKKLDLLLHQNRRNDYWNSMQKPNSPTRLWHRIRLLPKPCLLFFITFFELFEWWYIERRAQGVLLCEWSELFHPLTSICDYWFQNPEKTKNLLQPILLTKQKNPNFRNNRPLTATFLESCWWYVSWVIPEARSRNIERWEFVEYSYSDIHGPYSYNILILYTDFRLHQKHIKAKSSIWTSTFRWPFRFRWEHKYFNFGVLQY